MLFVKNSIGEIVMSFSHWYRLIVKNMNNNYVRVEIWEGMNRDI